MFEVSDVSCWLGICMFRGLINMPTSSLENKLCEVKVLSVLGTVEALSLLEVGKGYHSFYRSDGHGDREPGTRKCLEVRHCSRHH